VRKAGKASNKNTQQVFMESTAPKDKNSPNDNDQAVFILNKIKINPD